MIRQKMDSLSFELLSRMAHMMTRMTRMTHWLDSNDSLARWLAVCQDPKVSTCLKTAVLPVTLVIHPLTVLFILFHEFVHLRNLLI